MKLQTVLQRTPWAQKLSPRSHMLFMGSCFGEHIGNWLRDAWLNVTVCPTGVLFNPCSIADALCAWKAGQQRHPQLFENNGLYHSFSHHGKLSYPTETDTQIAIEQSEQSGCKAWDEADYIFCTFGSAWVYERQGKIVANCHKFPEREFSRRCLSVDEIVTGWASLIEGSQKKWVFTISPIRHLRDGLPGNQLSKATLLLAVNRLSEMFPKEVLYLPVYELFMDELRDYRFYADDLIHPSTLALQAVREYISEVAFDSDLTQYLSRAESIIRGLAHRENSASPSETALAHRDTLLHQREMLIQQTLC